VLTPQAVRALFKTLRRLVEEGVSILYISHKLDEIRELCDVATVLRNGRVSGTANPRQESSANLARLMVGSDLKECKLKHGEVGVIQLELTNLSLATKDPFGTPLRQLNLRVRAGEIVGIAGVSGNGQKELQMAISGERLSPLRGAVRMCGQEVGRLRPAQRRRLGFCFVPEERLGRGAVPGMSLADNAVLTGAVVGLVRYGLVRHRAARAFARATIDQFAVKCDGELAQADSLSGGNLQKFVVGREIRLGPKMMLVAQPTWGVDVGASLLIRQALIDMRDAGAAVLVISEELDELFAICDQLAVLAGGRLSAAVPTSEVSIETVGLWMTGAFEDAVAVTPEAVHA
jgi:simple sugar transport system ATP-binding protein